MPEYLFIISPQGYINSPALCHVIEWRYVGCLVNTQNIMLMHYINNIMLLRQDRQEMAFLEVLIKAHMLQGMGEKPYKYLEYCPFSDLFKEPVVRSSPKYVFKKKKILHLPSPTTKKEEREANSTFGFWWKHIPCSSSCIVYHGRPQRFGVKICSMEL